MKRERIFLLISLITILILISASVLYFMRPPEPYTETYLKGNLQFLDTNETEGFLTYVFLDLELQRQGSTYIDNVSLNIDRFGLEVFVIMPTDDENYDVYFPDKGKYVIIKDYNEINLEFMDVDENGHVNSGDIIKIYNITEYLDKGYEIFINYAGFVYKNGEIVENAPRPLIFGEIP